MRADGTQVRQVTRGKVNDDGPAWGPGQSIAFSRDRGLFIVTSAGGSVHRLTRDRGGEAANPAWSPDGKLIAFDYRRPGFSSREIWLVGVDGDSRPQLVTKLPAVSTLPSWSPDGRRIAFQSNLRGGHFEIYTIGRDGRGLRRETRSAIDTIDPAWSPDGKEIAFSRDGAIWTVDRSRRVRKVTSGGNDSTPVWRPVLQH